MSFDLLLTVTKYRKGLDREAGLLETAIAAKVNELAGRLYDLIEGKLSGEVLQEQTGQLAGSVVQQAAAWAGAVCGASVGVPADSPAFQYGVVHEMGGLGYYSIFPKEALALAFEGGGGGGAAPWGGQFAGGDPLFVFTRHVNHPPAQKRPFIAPALAELEPMFYSELKAVLDDVLG